MVRPPAKATMPTKIQQPLTKAPEEIPEEAPEGEPNHMQSKDLSSDAQALPPGTTISKRGRVRKPVRRLIETYVALNAVTVPNQVLGSAFLLDIEQDSPINAFAASSDPDIMYLHQAMKEPDKAQFIKAMEQEVQAHITNDHWEMVPRCNVPEGVPVLPAV